MAAKAFDVRFDTSGKKVTIRLSYLGLVQSLIYWKMESFLLYQFATSQNRMDSINIVMPLL